MLEIFYSIQCNFHTQVCGGFYNPFQKKSLFKFAFLAPYPTHKSCHGVQVIRETYVNCLNFCLLNLYFGKKLWNYQLRLKKDMYLLYFNWQKSFFCLEINNWNSKILIGGKNSSDKHGYRTRAIISQKGRIFWKNLLNNKEMVLGNGVKNIQAAAYNGARMVLNCTFCTQRFY